MPASTEIISFVDGDGMFSSAEMIFFVGRDDLSSSAEMDIDDLFVLINNNISLSVEMICLR